MGIYFCGDIHGDPYTTFSYERNPELKTLTENDIVIQLGDFGCIWDKGGNSKNDRNKLRFLATKPWTTIVVLGNHENYDEIEKMPYTEIFGGKCRQGVYMNEKYKNIFFVDFPTIFTIEDKKILCVPKAESHDIWNLLDPNEPNFKIHKKQLNESYQFYRVIGESWWPQEKMNIDEFDSFIDEHYFEHFNYICSHDAPAALFRFPGTNRGCATDGERYMEMMRQNMNFDCWVHGHFHFTGRWPLEDNRMICLYNKVHSEEDLVNIKYGKVYI